MEEKKLFRFNVWYGQYVFVASSKEEVLEMATKNDFIETSNVTINDVVEVKGYTVKGPSGEIGGYQE